MKPKLLLLEDDYRMATEVKLFINHSGFECEVVHDGAQFFEKLALNRFDAYILDVNVPVINGMEVCKQIRQTDKQTPILMLTAYSALENKVDALRAGADDYLVKPFHLEELAARIAALIRRSTNNSAQEKTLYQVEDLSIDTTALQVIRAGKEISLTPKEYRLLELLAAADGGTVSKQTIATKVWGINFETGTNTIEVYINYLRNKIDKGFDKPLIHTRPGFGYSLKASV